MMQKTTTRDHVQNWPYIAKGTSESVLERDNNGHMLVIFVYTAIYPFNYSTFVSFGSFSSFLVVLGCVHIVVVYLDS